MSRSTSTGSGLGAKELGLIFRSLLRSPSFLLTVVLTLALGIAATSSTYSLADAVFLRDLPYHEPERLLVLKAQNAAQNARDAGVSYPEIQDWKSRFRSFESVVAFSGPQDFNLSKESDPLGVRASFVSHDYFSVLGGRAAQGRTFLPEEDRVPAEHRVVVLSHALWRGYFGGDPAIVGKDVELNNQLYAVVGVMDQTFQDLNPSAAPDLWLPVAMAGPALSKLRIESRQSRWLNVAARLGSGVSLEQARSEAVAVAKGLERDFPDVDAGFSILPMTAADHFFGTGTIRRSIQILALGSLFVLLISCLNVASLNLSRSIGRRREMATRMAMGADRSQLVRYLLSESLVLSLLGGALGILMALWGTQMLLRFNPLALPSFVSVGLSPRVLLLTLVTIVIAAAIFGVLPALRGSKVDLRSTLHEGGRGGGGGTRQARLRNGLVMLELAVAVVLLVCAGLLLRSFERFQKSGVGFNTERLMIGQVQLSPAKYPTPAHRQAFYQELLERLPAQPGVEAAALWGSGVPGDNPWYSGLVPEGKLIDLPENRLLSYEHRISAGAIRMLGLPLVKGRDFDSRDTADATPVAVVSKSTAEAMWPGQEAIGKRFQRVNAPDSPFITVVGVVADSKQRGRQPENENPRDHYLPITQVSTNRVGLVVRGVRDAAGMAPALRQAVKQVDASMPLLSLASMDERLAKEERRTRFNALLMTVFAGAALFLALVGVYGVLVQSVTQRTYEIGLRMALGADRQSVLGLIGGQALRLVAVGVLAGVVAALVVGRAMASILYGISTTDVATFVTVPAVLSIAVFVASYWPVRRAMKIEPVVALKAS